MNENSLKLNKNYSGYHSSTQYVRTQSQEYLRTLNKDHLSLQQNPTCVQKKHQTNQFRGGPLSIGATMSTT